MLELIDYDLHGSHHHKYLRSGVHSLSCPNLNVRFSSWFLDSPRTPEQVCGTLVHHIGTLGGTQQLSDSLLVFGLERRVPGAVFNFNPNVVTWLREHGLDLYGKQERGERVLAISYTLYLGERGDYQKLQSAITHNYPDSSKPLHALWFVATDQTPRQVKARLAPLMHDKLQDQLLVVEIPPGSPGAAWNLPDGDRHRKWFEEHQIPLH